MSIQELTRLALQGDADAQYDLGAMYLHGKGVRKDEKEAVRWLTKAAESGLVDAQTLLAALYYDGIGVPQSLERAYYWNKRAADQGDVSSLAFIGIMHATGEGVPHDDNKAFEYLSPAAEQGNSIAQEYLGIMYFEGRVGGDQQIDEALYWFERAAAQGRDYSRNMAEGIRRWKAKLELENRNARDWLEIEGFVGTSSASLLRIADIVYAKGLRYSGYSNLLKEMPTIRQAITNIHLWGEYGRLQWNEIAYAIGSGLAMAFQVAAAGYLVHSNGLKKDRFTFAELYGGDAARTNDHTDWTFHYGYGFRYDDGVRAFDFDMGEWVNASVILNDDKLEAKIAEVYSMAEKKLMEALTFKQPDSVIPEMERSIAQYSTERIEEIRTNAKGRCRSTLVTAAANGYYGVIRSALQSGVSVQEKEYNGTTALEAAAAFGHIEAVRILLDASAKVNYRSDYHMETALMFACLNGHYEIAELLLARGADPNISGDYGNALVYAAVNNHKEIARLLIKRRINVNMAGQNNVTALHVASYKGYYNIVKMLLQAGASVSAVAHGSWTPLLLAVWKQKIKCASALLENGANPDDRLPAGQTALMLAAERGNVELVQMLCRYGANTSIRDVNGKTALSYAGGNTAVAQAIYYGGR